MSKIFDFFCFEVRGGGESRPWNPLFEYVCVEVGKLEKFYRKLIPLTGCKINFSVNSCCKNFLLKFLIFYPIYSALMQWAKKFDFWYTDFADWENWVLSKVPTDLCMVQFSWKSVHIFHIFLHITNS